MLRKNKNKYKIRCRTDFIFIVCIDYIAIYIFYVLHNMHIRDKYKSTYTRCRNICTQDKYIYIQN